MHLTALQNTRLPGGAVAIINVGSGSGALVPFMPFADRVHEVERALASVVSEADIVTPLGGQEMLVVMESHEGAQAVMERCLELLAAGGSTQGFTVRIGLAIDRRGTTPQERMWEKAEEAVARARAVGGGQIVVVESDGLVHR